MRSGGTGDDAQHLLNQALLEYKIEGDKRVLSIDNSAERNLVRRKESRNKKSTRLPKRKAEYESEKKGRENAKKKRLSESRAADRHILKTQIMTENATVTRAAVATKQAEQFGTFLALYAQKHNLSMPNLSNAMSPLTQCCHWK